MSIFHQHKNWLGFSPAKKKKKKPVMEDICHTCGIDFQSPADLAYDTLVVTMIVIMA